MKYHKNIYTVESVLKGHPDKICDQISDGLLDLYLEKDPDAHVAIECLGKSKTLIVAGEVNSKANISIERNSKDLYKNITGLSDINIINLVSQQSRQLIQAVEFGGAGDQGIMYGYAVESPYNYLKYGNWLVNDLARRLDLLREETKSFLPDGKIQATLSEDRLLKLTINVQHTIDANMEMLRSLIRERTLYDINVRDIIINPDEGFVRGGFENDTGLTGRKIIIDTYGGLAPHGGGAFSGKDPSKVDRSAAYMCRFVAKNLVANGFTKECCVSVAYNFGEEKPVMLHVTEKGKSSKGLTEFVKKRFDFCPRAIVERLDLKNTKYLPTATYGHFTNPNYPWEQIINIE